MKEVNDPVTPEGPVTTSKPNDPCKGRLKIVLLLSISERSDLIQLPAIQSYHISPSRSHIAIMASSISHKRTSSAAGNTGPSSEPKRQDLEEGSKKASISGSSAVGSTQYVYMVMVD